jgi:DNA-binding transcriptional ArsR family regulator
LTAGNGNDIVINTSVDKGMSCIVNSDRLDDAFLALADPVRRAIVASLSTGSATVNELAEPFAISKQAVSRHIAVLEKAGLVTRSRDAQRRPVHLDAAALEQLTAWIDRYRLQAEAAYRRLDAVLAASPPNKKEKES